MKQFCFFEHIGKCSRTLTHRAEYWRGNARRLYGPYAYFCSSHASAATRLGAESAGAATYHSTPMGREHRRG